MSRSEHGTRFLAGLLLAALAAATLGGPPARAQAAGTWAREWQVVGGQAQVAGLGEGVYESPVHDMGREFMAVGALWRARLPAGADLRLELRRSLDGSVWQPWQTLTPDDAAPDRADPGLSHGELLFGEGRYLQVRVSQSGAGPDAAPSLESLRIVAIDTRQGPQVGAAASAAAPAIISRAAWGANEAWMNWPPEYAPVLKFIVHHTATSNSYTDAAAAVRSIYYYHAITLNWGDIGYNYLVDREGRIYEGRAGGDGVIGGHARPYNSGTVGVALLGDYTTSPVPGAAVAALVELLAWKGNLHFVHPLEDGWLRDRVFPNIMGHRDCGATTCPGDRAYALLPQVRSSVYERMRAIPPRLLVGRPAADEPVAGVYRVAWRASPAAAQVTLAVDGQVRGTVAAAAGQWRWNATQHPDGPHRLELVARTDLGQATSVEVPVWVDNTPPTGTLLAPRFTSARAISLTLTCADCTELQLGAGWRWEAEDLPHGPGTGRVVADPAAANGQAWLGRAGEHNAGPWYGPYFCGLPSPASYEAVFWLRAAPADPGPKVVELDVSDHAGLRFLAGPWALAGGDFSGAYQPFRLPFHYPDPGTTCRGTGSQDGLELRAWFQATADLWLDRVEVLTAPQPFATVVPFSLPAAEGPHPVEVRFIDRAGNLSPLYAQTVTVDRTPPAWGEPTPQGLPLRDDLAGLSPHGAAYALSDDGITWDEWTGSALSIDPSGSQGLLPAQPEWVGRAVRARAQDRAGNVAYSPPLSWPPSGFPTPTPVPPYRVWAYCPHVTCHLAGEVAEGYAAP